MNRALGWLALALGVACAVFQFAGLALAAWAPLWRVPIGPVYVGFGLPAALFFSVAAGNSYRRPDLWKGIGRAASGLALLWSVGSLALVMLWAARMIGPLVEHHREQWPELLVMFAASSLVFGAAGSAFLGEPSLKQPPGSDPSPVRRLVLHMQQFRQRWVR